MIIPLIDRLIIRKVNIEQKTRSGIILTANEVAHDKDVEYGEVVEAGEGKDKDMKCKVGDIIVFNPRMPMRWTYKGDLLWIMRESDAFVILRDEELTLSPYSENSISDYKDKAKMLS